MDETAQEPEDTDEQLFLRYLSEYRTSAEGPPYPGRDARLKHLGAILLECLRVARRGEKLVKMSLEAEILAPRHPTTP